VASGAVDFDALDWHDAVLERVTIDRSEPGKRDDVVLAIRWPDGRRQDVRFVECRSLAAELNFGIVAPDAVLAARENPGSPVLAEIREKWRRLDELKRLRCFELETSSTGGRLTITAERLELTDAAAGEGGSRSPRFRLHQTVRIARDDARRGLSAGMLGAIVAVFTAPEVAYEVEFTDDSGRTTQLATIREGELVGLEAVSP
jgi:hypothetical protein